MARRIPSLIVLTCLAVVGCDSGSSPATNEQAKTKPKGDSAKQKKAKAHYNKGSELASEGNMAKALEELTKAVELDPKLAKAWFNRAEVHRRTGKGKEAIADYTKAIEANPKYAKAYCNRGMLYVQGWTGEIPDDLQIDKGRLDIKKATELAPKDGFIRAALGEASIRLGRGPEALEHFEKAVALDPKLEGRLRGQIERIRAAVEAEKKKRAR